MGSLSKIKRAVSTVLILVGTFNAYTAINLPRFLGLLGDSLDMFAVTLFVVRGGLKIIREAQKERRRAFVAGAYSFGGSRSSSPVTFLQRVIQ